MSQYRSGKQIFRAYIIPGIHISVYVVAIFIGNILFENSLTACNYDVIVCIKWLKSQFVSIIVQIFVYTLIHIGVFLFSLFNSVCYVKYTGIAIASTSYGYRMYTSKGFGNADHS